MSEPTVAMACVKERTFRLINSMLHARWMLVAQALFLLAPVTAHAQTQPVPAPVVPISEEPTTLRLASAEASIQGRPIQDVGGRATSTEGLSRHSATHDLPALPPPGPSREAVASRRPGSRDAAWWATRLGGGLGLFLAIMIVQKLFVSGTQAPLPAGAIQVCGKVPLDSKQFLHLVLIGQRLLVLLESPHGMQRLAEITDPEEVQRLVGPQRQINATSSKKSPHGKETAPTVSDVLSRFREFQNQLG